jgi:hypothetical protein
MERSASSGFERFAERFVRAFWETVKSGEFPMAPNEPVEETVEELLANVSRETEYFGANSGLNGPSYLLRMTGTYGDWWHFTFRDRHGNWQLVGATAKSDGETPHDLFGPVYSEHLASFLRHVTEVANQGTSADPQ